MQTKTDERNNTYGSFHLGTSEFAISVKSIQEVVNPPQEYTLVPLAPPHLLGLFNLRGAILPVVDLAVVLGLNTDNYDPALQKIVVIDCGDFNFGLRVGRTSEILKRGAYERFDFNKQEGDAHPDFICGALKIDEGRRIIQIIDAPSLLKIPGLSQQLNANSSLLNRKAKNRGPRKQCISFSVGPSRCAMGIDSIQEILKVQNVRESALGIGCCIGSIDLRGVTVPVIDFPSLLKHREPDRSAEATTGERRVVVMRLGEELFGLLVDHVESIISYFGDEFIPFKAESGQKLFNGTISRTGEKDLLLLNHAEILSDNQIQEITHGHSMLYNAKAAGKKDERGTRKTFITFKLNDYFAVSIDEVREIIDMPNELMHPPGLAPHFHGVINLRGTLVAVADGRTLYSMPNKDRTGNEKILVFENGESKYGLTVDSVESIAHINDMGRVRLPAILYQNNNNPSSQDVREAIEWNRSGDSASVVLMMLSLDSLAKRIAA